MDTTLKTILLSLLISLLILIGLGFTILYRFNVLCEKFNVLCEQLRGFSAYFDKILEELRGIRY